MQRIIEPELMNEVEQAIAYANADFEEPHNHFIELLKETFGNDLPESGLAADLGCGAADICIRFAKSFLGYSIDALDGSAAMLAEGKKAIRLAGLSERINLVQTNLQDATLTGKSYSIIICNAMLHHLHDPLVLWNLIKTAENDAKIFVMDLMRPESEDKVDWFVEAYAGKEPAVLRRDFRNSLKAAFTPEEVQEQLGRAGLQLKVSVVSDRHITISS